MREELTGRGLESSAASKEGFIYCDSRIKGIMHQAGAGRHSGKSLGQLGALHTSQEAERRMLVLSSHSPSLLAQDHSPGDDSTHF